MKDLSRLRRTELIQQIKALEAANRAGGSVLSGKSAASRDSHRFELRDNAKRLRAILQTAVEGIITIDERGIIESINPAAERIFGFTAGEIVGHNVSTLMPSPDREKHDGYIENYRRTGQAKIIGLGREVVGRRKDGTVFPMELSVSEVRLARRRLFTGFVRDITERRRLEGEILVIGERERRRMGHDLHDGICQHLAAIELLNQVLEQDLAVVSKQRAAQAGQIGRHLREVMEQTRLLARGLSPVVVEAEGLMAALRELAAGTKKMFKVACIFRCRVPVLIEDNAVATHLYRIAQEAVNNAIKHARPKRIEIGLIDTSTRIILAVRDDGAGIPAKLPRNKGMGLRVMQYRAGMIGGSLVIQKESGGGTSVVCSVQKSTVSAPALSQEP